MPIFCTLGPAGSNHHVVLQRYLALHGLVERATVELCADFPTAVARVLGGHAHFLLQCAVHPDTPATVARFHEGLFLVDSFISPSRDLAVLRRAGVDRPRTVAAMPATVHYTDLSRWGRVVHVATVADAAQSLLDGRHDAGLTFADLADAHPGRFVVETSLPSVDDAWLVYGRTRVSGGGLLAWQDAPAATLYRGTMGSP